ncbi:uncharacterized protein MONOS_6900 [Monocercomonoides exilis]|uniref:uncharacterized protein n=1 Tax=Monocercomonoides exilis TaxID=2049356 RepID=UPI0035593D02|nr:hypothetical protein MONOS_6900 [Monocercomonoides exilis]|eukprot:MONOS_6900.1-p1 / transcript=MONOS_6900.1 / gene=MONOS_6900 / organism=Monocercomonoides_exilis_PA203 / gene_product=unspecified product / transcript_product=unspecified product / location=Mono_scaffold00226:34728-35634(+) / protein_length=186 / sequence_SO=supercontig / SO=protein_coding / is_pseudo=false
MMMECLRQLGQRLKQGKREDKAATAIQSVPLTSSPNSSSASHFNVSLEVILFHLFFQLENYELSQSVDHSDPNVDVVLVSLVGLEVDVVWYPKKFLVAVEVQLSSFCFVPSSSSLSSTGAARRSTSPFRRRRSEEKKSSENEQSSSAPAIDPSDNSVAAASHNSAGAMDDIERRLECLKIKRFRN